MRSVTIGGQNDQLVVVGAGIDTAELTRLLRRKVSPTTSIVTVQAAPPPPPQRQQPPQYHLMEHHNEMAPARRCICEIPNSGYCGFCRSMRETPYQMVPSQYPPPVMYGGYREDPDNCSIMWCENLSTPSVFYLSSTFFFKEQVENFKSWCCNEKKTV